MSQLASYGRSLFACSLFASAPATAQVSDLYLTSVEDTTAYIVRNGAIVGQFNRTAATDGPALVVQSTIKMYGQSLGQVGREYDLAGNLLAGSYTNAGFVDCFDGATDGSSNWTISHNDFGNNFAVIRGDANWAGAAVAFVPGRRSSGITYDATDDTLWITNNVGGSDRVQHYDTAGNLLGEFPINMPGGGYGIALDPADQTLWIPGAYATTGQLVQYDKSGNLLQTLSVPGMTLNVLGAEFAASSPFVKYCQSNPTSTGAGASISASGSNSVSANDLTLTAAPVPNQNFLFFFGPNQTRLPFGNGFLCVTGGLTRILPPMPAVGNVARRTLDLAALGIAPGVENFQCWFRDPAAGGAAFNTSDALSITFVP